MKTLDQIRAEFAWRKVRDVSERHAGVYDKYRNLAKGMPALVMSNGLMQTLAFLQGKAQNDNEHALLVTHILAWLQSPHAQVLTQQDGADFGNAMNRLAACDSLHYQRATEETLAILKWIRYLVDTLT